MGLTSPRMSPSRSGWVSTMRCLPYDDIGGDGWSVPSVFVDIAGDANVRAAVHATLPRQSQIQLRRRRDALGCAASGTAAGRACAQNVLCAGRGEEADRRLGRRRLLSRSSARRGAPSCRRLRATTKVVESHGLPKPRREFSPISPAVARIAIRRACDPAVARQGNSQRRQGVRGR